MKIEKLSDKELLEARDWLKCYKFVSRCSECKNLFGHDKQKEKLCANCDKNFSVRR